MILMIIRAYFNPVPPPKECPIKQPHPPGSNHAVVYTGRYQFFRIQFPYLYRDLRINGGVLDTIDFMMVKYEKATRLLIEEISDLVNKKAGFEVLRMFYLGFPVDEPASSSFYDGVYPRPYYIMFEEISTRPFDKYFKIDDDIVYIHPSTFENMIRYKDPAKCTVHFANIAGSNWRASYIHQVIGLYENTEINKDNLIFEFGTNIDCGHKSLECAELSLKAFIYHYKRRQLSRYMFEGLHLFMGRERFSIQFMLIDKDALDFHALRVAGVITVDDEGWWTSVYGKVTANPHCIIGQSLVVHFSYSLNSQELIKRRLLLEFENIVVREVGRKMPAEIWAKLDYDI